MNKQIKLILRYCLLMGVLLFGINSADVVAQVTPGLIVQPANAAGSAVMDPDGDGYVSAKTNGNQLGFTNPPNNDVLQSEIPYVAVVKPDPRDDLLRGPTGSFSEIVGVDEAGNNAILSYFDGTNYLFRFRLDGMSPNTITYCLLIDTDGKFGFTGPNADPNAVSGNAGFEIEITLTTNFHVRVWDVDGKTKGVLKWEGHISQFHQKAVAITTSSNNPDYFYDFYVPLSALTSIVFADSRTQPSSITSTTPLRIAAVTTMNTAPAIGNNAISDVGGATGSGSLDQIFITFINSITPTPPGEEVLERSACPTINSVAVGNTTITGSTTDPIGTLIKVTVFASNGTTPVGTKTVVTTGSTWSVNLATAPAISLVAGQIVRATAIAPEKGESADNCSQMIVTSCTVKTDMPLSANVVIVPGGKGFRINSVPLTGTVVRLYASNYTLYPPNDLLAGQTNPRTTTSNGQQVEFSYKGGQNWPAGVYYITFQEPGKCESDFFVSCLYATGTSSAPTITSTNIIAASSNTITGAGTAASSTIHLYVNGEYKTSTTSAASSPFGWSTSISGLNACDLITARQITGIACLSAPSSAVEVKRLAATPVILSTSCVTAPFTLNGTSSEANGTTVTLYQNNSSGSVLGTATVTDGFWQVINLNLASGTVVVAKVTAGSCLSPSADSTPITISTKTNIGSYNISIINPQEGSSTVSGSISGGTYPITIIAYVNQVATGDTVTVNSAGSFTISGFGTNELYVGAQIKITVQAGTGCESALSSTTATVQCSPPAIPAFNEGSYSYCLGGTGLIEISNTQTGVIYQLVSSNGEAQGPAAVGNGGSIALSTNVLAGDLTGLYIYAYKILNPSCGAISTTAINFDIQNPAPTVTFSSTSLAVQAGDATVNISYTDKSGGSAPADFYTISWSVAAKNQGFIDITSQTAIPAAPGNIVIAVPTAPAPAPGTYSGTILVYSDGGTGCIGGYSFTVSVFGATSPPVITNNPTGTSICSESSTTLSVAATGTGTLSYQWQSSTSFTGTYSNVVGGSGATTATYTTPTLTATRYYRVLITNAYGSTISQVSVISVTDTPAAAGSITGPDEVRKGGSNFILYSIAPIAGADSYEWTYDGTGATILGSGTSVYVSFSADATDGKLVVRGKNSTCNLFGAPAELNIQIKAMSHIISNKNVTPFIRR